MSNVSSSSAVVYLDESIRDFTVGTGGVTSISNDNNHLSVIRNYIVKAMDGREYRQTEVLHFHNIPFSYSITISE